MSAEKIVEEYLARAREAEDQADKTTDSHMRASWQRIAKSYRQMAQNRLDGVAGTAAAKPLPGHQSQADRDRTEDA